MAFINENFLKLSENYLFAEIARRVEVFRTSNPDKASHLIRCGIGDVTEPLPAAAVAALHKAADDMALRETFRGYGPEAGYEFLRHAIAENDYRARGIAIEDDEIFVSDGSKCDCANILDIMGEGNVIAIPDPVYPVYVDTNIMADRGEVFFLDGTRDNGFVPMPPDRPVDLIYLCFPNNPTGAVASRAQLEAWVAYAQKNNAIILFDGAYEAFIRSPDIPHSIYEIPGATSCAIEMHSFSKNGGFTGVRCGFTVVPKALMGRMKDGKQYPLHPLWRRRQSTKFNGVSYVVQCAAEALYSTEGKAQVSALTDFYMENARLLAEALTAKGWTFSGGTDAPYLWVTAPQGKSSWDMFSYLLDAAQIVVTPGAGFGAKGEGFFRISSFNARASVEEACRRLVSLR